MTRKKRKTRRIRSSKRGVVEDAERNEVGG